MARSPRRRARGRPQRETPPRRAPADGLSPGAWVALAFAFLGAALLVYRPAQDGPFVSDDLHYVAENAYVHELSLENLAAILHPAGAATVAVVNYTPVHLLLHTLAWEAFGTDVTGHHLLNVVLHVAASLLLAVLLARSGIPVAAALLGGAFFLLHPANVEAVAWISQLKTSSSMVLALGSLLAFPRRPALGTVLFTLALLAKPTAAFALPVAVLLAWTGEDRAPWRWFAACAAIFAAYAVAEFSVHQRSGAAEATLYETPFVLVRTVASLTLRYAVMGATSYGVSAFHEPDPAVSILDPWWLGSLVLLGVLGWRSVDALRRRRPELAFWVWAVVSFAPISQVFPFLYPFADRYLYPILPGLMGGALLWANESLGRVADPNLRRQIGRGAIALAAVVLVLFAVRSHERAEIWSSPARLVADAAAHYPDGVSANLLRAKRAAQVGDAEGAAAAVRAAHARGYNRFEQLLTDPGLAPVQGSPAFQAVIHEIAAGWIESTRRKSDPTQLELRKLAHAHVAREEYREAAAALRRALERGGPGDAAIRTELTQVQELMLR